MATQHKRPDDNIRAERSFNTDSLEHSIITLAGALRRRRNHILARHSLTGLGYEIMRLLLSQEPFTMGQLTRAVQANLSQTSREVDSLIHKGLLHRWRPAIDRRVVLVKLTQDGAKLASDLQALETEQETSFTKGLKVKELDTFRRLANKMHSNLKDSTPRPS